jgi:dinuclear metal center YbgI/SA1388 family protein
MNDALSSPGVVSRAALRARLEALLESALFVDYGPNGLQVEGRDEIRRVTTGVTASLALLEAAAARRSDAVVVHHGIFWDGASPVLCGAHKRRVETLFAAGMSLFAYHLPLDAHPEVGNNAPALRELGVGDLAPFAPHKGRAVGWRGRLPEPVPAAEFAARVAAYYGSQPIAFLHGPPRISTVGLVSGAAQGDARQAVAAGLDCFITGEISEYNQHLAVEERIHHLSVGHHASERVGPRLLARWLREHCGLDAEFVDVPNPA